MTDLDIRRDNLRIRLTGRKGNLTFRDCKGTPYSYRIAVDQCLGEGASCICYEVTVYRGQDEIGQKRVLKQFYPDPAIYDIVPKLDGMTLEIPGYTRYQELNDLGAFFERAYRRQVNLGNDPEISDLIVHPELHYFEGSTKYILYEPDYGSELNLENIRTVDAFLETMLQLANALGKLHEKGLLYVDLKPSNVLISSSKRVKLFDFDASIDTKALDDFHLENGSLRYDPGNLGAIAPEIRPERLRGEFEQNKKWILRPEIDVYSFGAMMLYFFLRRYPTEKDISAKDAFEAEIRKKFTYRFRGELGEDAQKILTELIWKCIQKETGPGNRYSEMKKVAENLEAIRTSTQNVAQENVKREVEDAIQAAYVMDGHPLTEYRRRQEDQTWVMDALILGEHPVGAGFFANILSCAQMLDTKLVLRYAVPHAGERLKEYLGKWPLLKKSTVLYLDDVPLEENFAGYSLELDPKITETPFAEIRFYDLNTVQEKKTGLWDFVSGMKEIHQSAWMVICGTNTDENLKDAQEIAEGFTGKRKNAAENTPEFQENYFVGYLDARGDGYGLRSPGRIYPGMTLEPFSCSSYRLEEEKNFESGITAKAVLLHKFYTREWNERQNKKELHREFTSKTYNFRSSLCGALSLPYKLESVGISAADPAEAAMNYYKEVLGTGENALRKMNRLIYLEHRRWMCFMMTEGYDRPSEKVVEQYAFVGNNDQRNRTDLLHTCISASGVDNGIVLDTLSRQDWEEKDYVNHMAQQGKELDELDRMSIWFHQLCGRLIEKRKQEGTFDAAFASLERAMRAGGFEETGLELLQSMKHIYEKMLAREVNSAAFWNQNMSVLQAFIETEKKGIITKTARKEMKKAADQLGQAVKIILEYNAFHDYKSSNRTILEVVPLLLQAADPVACIHKPVAEQTWQDVLSSIIIEPQKLILYEKEDSSVDLELIREFLCKRRNLEITGSKIQVKPWTALKKLKAKPGDPKNILDVTGVSRETLEKLFRMENLEGLPFIRFENGKLQSLKGASEADFYSVLRRHITVEEAFFLNRAKIFHQEKMDQMLSLIRNYENIWEACFKMGNVRYQALSDVLRAAEQRHYWKLSCREEQEADDSFSQGNISGAMLHETGISRILSQLKKDGWIQNFTAPARDGMGKLTVKGCTGEVKQYVERMLELEKKEPRMHRFELLKDPEGITEEKTEGGSSSEPAWYIYDNTKLVNTGDLLFKNQEEAEAVKTAFDWLEKQQDMIISRIDQEIPPVCFSEEEPLRGHLRFLYYNAATRECLIRRDRILKTYLYHMIWKNVHIDDLKMNVSFAYDECGGKLDLVCTRNMKTFFLSCRLTAPEEKQLQQLQFLAKHLGMDGKAVLITGDEGYSRKLQACEKNSRTEPFEKAAAFFCIDRALMGSSWEEIEKENIVKYLQNIFDGKEEWKLI